MPSLAAFQAESAANAEQAAAEAEKIAAAVRPHRRALLDIAAERRRQPAKGYDAAHDDGHANGEIIYADGWGAQARLQDAMERIPGTAGQRACLIEAAAMIVAEVERMDRAAAAGRTAA